MEESIYNLLPKAGHAQAGGEGGSRGRGGPRYVSKHAQQVKKEARASKKGTGKTLSKVEPPSPKKFLKKNAGVELKKRAAPKQQKSNVKWTKPPVPRKHEKPVMGLKTDKNYVRDNAVDNMKAKPKQVKPRRMDLAGNRFDVEDSGLVPKYSKKKDYGKAPEYLTRRKQQEETDRQAYQAYLAATQNEGALVQVSEQERQDLLAGLRANWEQLHKTYLNLPVMADTRPKILRKNKMEADLAQLEADIALLENHAVIYVDQQA